MIEIKDITSEMLDAWIADFSRGDGNKFILLVGRNALNCIVTGMSKIFEPFVQREIILMGNIALYQPDCIYLNHNDYDLLEKYIGPGKGNNVLIAFDPNNPREYIKDDSYVAFGNVPEDVDITDIPLVAKSDFNKLEMKFVR